MQIFLASKSPRRQQLLRQIEIPFETIDVDINEHWDGSEHAGLYVERLALEKAKAGLEATGGGDGTIVIGADTAVVIDDEVLGKAETINQAKQMLRRLSGRMHHVYSAVAIAGADRHRVECNRTSVCFRPLTDVEIDNYCDSGEALGKAGGYAIQGKAAVFVESIQGSYSGVVGLPLYETYQLLSPLLVIPHRPSAGNNRNSDQQ